MSAQAIWSYRIRRGVLAAVVVVLLAAACAAPPAAPAIAPGPAPAPASAAPASGASATTAPRAEAPPPTPAPPLTSLIFAVTSFNANYLPLLIAEEHGYYARAGIRADVQAMQIPIAMAGVASGEIGYAFAANSLVGAAMQGQPLRQLAIINVGSFFIYSDPSIQSVADLRGKTLTIGDRTGIQDYLMRALLRGHGLDPERDVSVVHIPVDLAYAALQSGQVQAAMAQLPIPLLAERDGYRIIANTADYGRFPTASVGTSLDRMANQTDQVRAVIRGTLLGIKHLKERPGDGAEILARHNSIPLEEARRTVELMLPSYMDNGLLTDEDIRRVIEERRTVLGNTQEFAPSDLVDFRLLREVLRELGIPE
jgi:ABC-type nitrate/sulfonate/bicarbonate transport system substrate-binding protein